MTDEQQIEDVTASQPTRVACCWEVVAGMIPGQPIPELTRRFALTSAAARAENAPQAWADLQADAMQYVRELTDLARLNWVRVFQDQDRTRVYSLTSRC